MKQFLLIAWIGNGICQPAVATELSFDIYLNAMRQTSATIIENNNRISQANNNLEAASQFYTTQIGTRYSKNRIKQGPLNSNSDSYSLKWDQQFATGTTISTNLQEEGFGVINQSSQSITLTQSLWKDAFGKQAALNKDYSHQSQLLAQQTSSSLNITTCLEAAKSYLALLSAQDQMRRSQKRLEDSKNIYRRFEKLFKQNLVRKIDYLNSKDSYLQSEEDFSNLKGVFFAQIRPLESLIEKPINSVRPLADLKVTIHPQDKSKNIQVLELEQQIRTANALLALNNGRDRIDVQLFLSGQKINSDFKSEESATSIGVAFDITLFDPNIKNEKKNALASLSMAEELKIATEKGLIQQRRQLLMEIENLTEKEKRLRLRLSNSELRLTEAQRLLDTIQIEIADFINYQQQTRQISDEIYSAYVDRLIKNLELAIVIGDSPSICGA